MTTYKHAAKFSPYASANKAAFAEFAVSYPGPEGEVDVAIQLLDVDGNPVRERISVDIFTSHEALPGTPYHYQALSSTVVEIVSNQGILIDLTSSGSNGTIVVGELGTVTIRYTADGGKVFNLNVVLPDGSIATSPTIDTHP